jgi:hypothetical protein
MSRGLAIALLVVVVQPAAAHVPELRGRLIDAVGRSDLVVVGTVEQVRVRAARQNDTTVRVVARLIGETNATTVTFGARPRFATGERFVFFLRRTDAGLECVQAAGTVFRARPEDDAAYRETIPAIQRALQVAEKDRAAALRAAIIPALSAPAPTLRYYAVLDLSALAHHGLTEPDRRSLERLVADPATDPAIRPIVAGLLRTAPQPASGPVSGHSE